MHKKQYSIVFAEKKVLKSFLQCTTSKRISTRFILWSKVSLPDILNSQGNLQFYPRLPKMPDCSIIAYRFCAESLGIDSENYLWLKLRKDYHKEFPDLIDRSNFNKRRRRLRLYIDEVTKQLSVALNDQKIFSLLIQYLCLYVK